MNLEIEVQVATTREEYPDAAAFRSWIRAALQDYGRDAEVLVRIVDEQESAELNASYRGKQGPTNVLSFPFEAPPGVPAEELGDLLGDLVMCAPVIIREASEQGKSPQAHWAHMTVHGTLHLLGYDHQTDQEAGRMEALETRILAELGFPCPYEPSAYAANTAQ